MSHGDLVPSHEAEDPKTERLVLGSKVGVAKKTHLETKEILSR